ncbi:MAG: hypothetical protein WCP35_08615 [Verrucomicrobiota bacterium]
MPHDFHRYPKTAGCTGGGGLWHASERNLRHWQSRWPIIERWLAKGRLQASPLREWKRRILLAQRSPVAFDMLMSYLEAENDDSEPIKSCSPFVGLELEIS